MIVKGTKQLGSFKRGVNLYIPKRKTSAAPSIFPNVGANGQQISVSNFYHSGVYTKVPSGDEAGYVNASRVYKGPYESNGSYFSLLVFNVGSNRWEFGGVSDSTGNGEEWNLFRLNPSSNQDVIPAAGWTDSHSPVDLTITAA